MTAPRILHIINNLDAIGGAELALVRLLERRTLGRFTHEVVAMLEDARLAPRLRAVDVDVHALGLARRDLGLPARLLRLASRPRPALYVGWMYYSNLLASCLGTLHGVPVMWNVLHSLHDVSRSGWSTELSIAASTQLAQQPDSIVYNSATSQALHLARGWPVRNARVVHTGVDVTLFQPDEHARARARSELAVSDDTMLIGRFGRYHLLKGYESLLRAFAASRTAQPTCLALGGRDLDANNTSIVRLIAELGIADRVRLLGERDDLPSLLPAFDLCVSSSHSESFPNVVAEAMASGVPCVVTDVGDSAHMVGDTGWVVPANDDAAMCTGLQTALAALGAAPQALRAAARARAVELFSLQHTVAEFEAMFDALAQRDR